MDKEIIALFKLLKENNIRYVILRGYIPLEELNQSEDIDIYIYEGDRRRVIKLLQEYGWYKPKMNVNKNPHIQLYKFSLKKVYKIDLVTDIYFGTEFYHLKNCEMIIERRKLLNNLYYVPCEEDALKLLELHIILDKKELSNKNKVRLEELSRVIEDNLIEISDWECNILNKLLNNNWSYKKIIDHEFKSRFNVESKKIYKIKSDIKYRMIFCCAKMRNLLKSNSICIIGVDGTGKSTVVKGLANILTDHVVVQYMGFRSYETKLAQRYNKYKPQGVFENFFETLVIYVEMWYRYLKNRFNRNNIILYDRFVNESYINAKGLRKIMTTFLFKYMFPKPKKMYYLYCPVDVSFERKDDILNKEQFKVMKKKFDNIYLNNNILSFDSSKNDEVEIIENIYNDLLKYFAEYII